MSEVKVNKISPRTACGTVTLGDSGDTFTIPSGVSITNQGTASGFGATGETSWVTTVKTATFTATAGEGYFCNTTGGVFTVNLPAGSAGASVAIVDYAGTFQTNNLTISPNGTEKIGGINANSILSTEGQSVTFVYIDGTQGWVNVLDSTSNVTGNPFIQASVSGAGNTLATAPDCANYNIATFTGPGTFTVSAAAVSAPNNAVDYLVIAGGGGGTAQGSEAGGGGGAGGYRASGFGPTPLKGSAITVSAQAYSIAVGAGGAAGFSPNTAAVNGVNTTALGLTATGGGHGCAGTNYGTPGGSGGGGGQGPFTGTGSYYNGPGCAGAGNTPPVSPLQGNPGGTGFTVYNTPPSNTNIQGGGGGGVGVCGTDGAAGIPSNVPGGAGAPNAISGSSVNYAGGGGAGQHRQGPSTPFGAGVGGVGGGGNGGYCGDAGGPAGGNGSTNTGGGGGGGGNAAAGSGGAGGSGIVIIRYKAR
jgi:hypothetical protein